MSFFEKLEVWKQENIFLKYVFLNFNDYKNINFNVPIGLILILFALILPVVVLLTNKRRNVITFTVKQLVRHEAFSEDKAKTLSALRLSKIKSLRKMLLSSGQLSSMVKIAGYKQPSYEDYIKDKKEKKKDKKTSEKFNLDEAKIYLTEEHHDKAKEIASSEITPIWKPILIIVAGILIITAVLILMPELLELLNSSLRKK